MSRVARQFPSLADAKAKLSGALRPETYFPALVIGKRQVANWERELKALLQEWFQQEPTAVSAVLSSLSDELLAWIERVGQEYISNAGGSEQELSQSDPENKENEEENLPDVVAGLKGQRISPYSKQFAREHFFPMLLELDKQNNLPALVFCLDRDLCEELCIDTLEKLEMLEEETRKTEDANPGDKQRLKKQIQKKAKRMRDKLGRNKEDDDPMAEVTIEQEDPDGLNVDPRFSFIEPGDHMDKDELDFWLRRTLHRNKWSKHHPLIRALYRGIGVHHGRLSRSYRSLVETLFRYKHLKVVLCTETLAMGVNMPCKSAIFCLDHPRLTPLTYRQCMGRAGRRGYDNVGYVGFFGVPPRKISYLMTSPLMDLHGHFPLSTGLSLRMVDFFSRSSSPKEVALRLQGLVKASYRVPHYVPPTAETTTSPPSSSDAKAQESGSSIPRPPADLALLQKQISFHFRYSLEYLVQMGLVESPSARASGLASLISHLHPWEPGNFAFAAALESGLVHSVCRDFNAKGRQKQVAKQLLELLAYLFLPIPWPASKKAAVEAASASSSPVPAAASSHSVVLPPPPPKLDAMIARHNKITTSLFTEYCKLFAHTEFGGGKRVPAQLPVSARRVSSQETVDLPSGSDTVLGALNEGKVDAEARSPFAALLGKGDEFESAHELAHMAHPAIHMQAGSIPVLEFFDSRGQPLPLNAYAVDFYSSESYDSLLRYNGLSGAGAWDCLKEWSVLLDNMTHGIECLSQAFRDEAAAALTAAGKPVPPAMLDGRDDCVLQAFKFLNSSFSNMFTSISVAATDAGSMS
eukprot:GABV01000035.1.p1 GENE.GABV01000035.1~~GABV01000035.1.p1  ORF type:complete len:852 (-),score=295.83 GABV01000035.1:6-2429(-)